MVKNQRLCLTGLQTVPGCDRQTDRQMDGRSNGITIANRAYAL